MHELYDSDAYAYLVSQLSYITPRTFEKKYGNISYPELVPVSFEANSWATAIETFYVDGVAIGKDINSAGDDIPFVQETTSRDQLAINLAAIGFEYNLDELEKAQALGIPLEERRANLARRGYEEHAQRRCYVGDSDRSIEGLLNHSAVPTAAAASTFAAALAGANPGDAAAALVNEAISAVWVDTKQIERANTVLLPTQIVSDLSTTRLGSTSDITIMEFVKKNNVYTLETEEELMIRALPQLTGTLNKMVTYSRNPDVMTYHIPMALEFLAPQVQNLKFRVPGRYKLAGLELRYPGAMNYRSGI